MPDSIIFGDLSRELQALSAAQTDYCAAFSVALRRRGNMRYVPDLLDALLNGSASVDDRRRARESANDPDFALAVRYSGADAGDVAAACRKRRT